MEIVGHVIYCLLCRVLTGDWLSLEKASLHQVSKGTSTEIHIRSSRLSRITRPTSQEDKNDQRTSIHIGEYAQRQVRQQSSRCRVSICYTADNVIFCSSSVPVPVVKLASPYALSAGSFSRQKRHVDGSGLNRPYCKMSLTAQCAAHRIDLE